MAEEETFSAKQVATRIGTEAKTLRKFLRDPNSGYKAVGQGGRYEFPKEDLPVIKAAFDAWNAGKVKRNRPTNAERALAQKARVIPKPREEAEAAPRTPRRSRNTPPPSPLDEDDLLTRCRQTIGQRARAKGVTTDNQGRWKKVEEPERKLLTKDEALAIVPGLAASVEEASASFNSMLADLSCAEIVEEEH